MEQTILKAMPRTDTPRKLRRAGLIPGVLNESDTTATSVQFEAAELKRVIERHGPSARVWVQIGKTKKSGYIKEVQKHPVDWNIIHVAIQVVEKGHEVHMHLPVAFHGRDDLLRHSLQLIIVKADAQVAGSLTEMPESIVVDVSKMVLGGHVTAADFHLPKGIRVLDPADEVYGVVKNNREVVEEEPEKPAENVPPPDTAAPAKLPGLPGS